jgi:hypothetical protein
MSTPRKPSAPEYTGGCLCGRIRYRLTGKPMFPHFCSCHQCQRWSGAPVVAWADFPRKGLVWDGPGGEPALFRSSAGTQRGFCSSCGGTLCALDDGSDKVSMTIATLDDPNSLVPKSQSFRESAPVWLRVKAEVVKKAGKAGARRRRSSRGR